MDDSLRARMRTFLNRVMVATRVLPMLGFGRAPEPPTDGIRLEGTVESPPAGAELHEQQHVDVPARATGKRPRG